MDDILSYAARVIIIYIFTYFAGRLLPKKAIAQMTAYELAGVMLFTTVAAEPLVTKVTTKSIFGTGLVVVLILLTGRIAMSNKLTFFLEHLPTVLINNGIIDVRAMKEASLSLNQLMGLLRQKGYDNIQNIQVAVLEPQGNISVIPKASYRPVQPSDLNLTPQPAGLYLPLIMDGEIIIPNLKYSKISEEWLIEELTKQGATDYRILHIVQLDPTGKIIIVKSEKNKVS